MKDNLIPLVMGLIFLIVGVVCLVWPEKVQEFAIRWSGQGLGKYNPFLGWMKTRGYIWMLRIIGIIAIGVFILALFVVVKAQK